MSSENPSSITMEMRTIYRAEIEHRLEQLGWTKEDMEFPTWSPQRVEWLNLVEPLMPSEINDEAWSEVKPKLLRLLSDYHEFRLKMERNTHRADRFSRVSQLFSNLGRETPPLVSFEISEYGSPDPSRTRTVCQERAFPAIIDALQWPVIESILEADTTADELEQAFNSRRTEIDALVTEWRIKLHRQLVDTIPGPAGEILRPTRAIAPNPFQDIPDEIKLLLRADSLFLAASSPTKVLTYNDVLQLTKSDSYSCMSPGMTKPEKPLDIASITKFPLARGVARALLESLGCSDASYLELEGEWICGRCHDTEPRRWSQMVEHYVQEQLFHFAVRSNVRKMHIPYYNVHNPLLFTDKPLIKYLSKNVLEEELPRLRGHIRQCMICARNPIRKDVRGWEGKILEHLLDAHGIQYSKFKEHYGDPVAVATPNNVIGLDVCDLYDEDEATLDVGGEMYDYDEDGMFGEADPGYDSDSGAWFDPVE